MCLLSQLDPACRDPHWQTESESRAAAVIHRQTQVHLIVMQMTAGASAAAEPLLFLSTQLDLILNGSLIISAIFFRIFSDFFFFFFFPFFFVFFFFFFFFLHVMLYVCSFGHDSRTAPEMAILVCQSSNFFQTEISQQLQNGLPKMLIQTFMVPRR